MYKLFGVELCFSFMLFSWFIYIIIIIIFLNLNNISLIINWEVISCISRSLEFDLIIDWIRCSFSGLVCFISGCVIIFRKSYIKGDKYSYRFSLIVMLFVLSINLLIFIPNLVSVLLGWDGLGLVSFCLVIYYQNSKSLAAGILTVLINRVGDCFILAAISIIIVLGHWNMLCLWEFYNFMIVNFFIIIAGITKRAQIPFSSWLPAAIAAPTPVSALVHSSTLVTAGVFLFIRFFNYLRSYVWFRHIMLYLSIITTIISGVCALYEYDIKKIIALSTLSQLGVIIISLRLGMPILTLFHLYTHAIFKALLFICGGNIIHCFEGNQDIRCIKNVFNLMPVTSMFLIISKIALCGLPFLAGFYSKDLIIERLITGNLNVIILILGCFGVCLTVLYSIRFCFFIVWRGYNLNTFINASDNDLIVIISIRLLGLGALWGGYIFQRLFCLFDQVFILSGIMKLYVPMFIIIRIIISFGLWDKDLLLVNKGIIKHINRSIWFLSSFICNFRIKNFILVSNRRLKILDMGWIEILGGQGIFQINKLAFNCLEHWVGLMLNCYIIMFVVICLFIL